MNEAADLEDRFFNFPPATLAAIRDYRRSRDPALVGPVLRGIVEKYLPESHAAAPAPESALNAFGLESLTLIEVLLDIQDALGITLTDEELRALRNLDEARALLVQKVVALRDSAPPQSLPSSGPAVT